MMKINIPEKGLAVLRVLKEESGPMLVALSGIEIALLAGCSRRTVCMYIPRLEALGVIKRVGKEGRTTVYEVMPRAFEVLP